MSVFVIAEAGVNHNGSLQLARDLVDVAASTGADAVKFQTFRAEDLVTPHAGKAAYQRETTDPDGSQLAMLKRLELSHEDHLTLAEYCRQRGIQFLSTPFDVASLRFLVEELAVSRLKVPSGEITNAPLLLEAARSGRPLVVSTGMTTLGEVADALAVLAFGCTHAAGEPGPEALETAYGSAAGRAALRDRVTLLHCTSEYPTRPPDVHLRAMDTLASSFGLPVGYSDHTQGIAVSLAAVARGATVIEKHFTLDRSLPGPDHRASLEPGELEALVAGIRAVEAALGRTEKAPTAGELEVRAVARKSLVAAAAIAEGERFTSTNVAVRRPGTGVSPMRYWEYLGRPAQRAYRPNELLE